ncbi:rhodanese-like domain-containing protein [Pseudomonas matsuisoli]|uniref:Rhodanese-like domain-containing protein n=1 Tax=Pseudomonas matsuisoli TaxID=1515666 RepID=A0A917UTB2_9PSED|nr:rhodanese-like domain-containing protein [Pseudomonas matsuisoli]GGJ83522.1 rhodanese-like domain-containing protein [Pseudomonas matsuisoli]
MVAKFLEFATNHYLLVGLFFVLLIALLFNEMRRAGRALTSGQLTSLVNADQGVVVDIRPAKEFATGRVAGAVNIPQDKLVNRISELDKYKGKTIIVVDASGQHSGSACQELKKAGHTVARLSGGMSTWRADNLPVVK